MAEARLQLLMDLEDRVSGQLKGIRTGLEGFREKVEDMKPAFQKMAAIGTAGFAAITGEIGFALKAFAESQAQLARVDQILNNLFEQDKIKGFGDSYEEAQKKVRDFGASLQALGGIGDETAAEGLAKLAQITGDYTKAAKAATLAADVATYKQIDYGTAVDIVGKVLNGNVAILKKYGIEVDENMSKEEAMAALTEKVGGQYQAFGKTIEGQTAILKQSFGDIQENIGAAFLPILQQVLDKIKPVIDKIVAWTAAHPELVKNIMLAGLALSGLIAVLGTLGLVLPAVITGIEMMTGPLGLVMIAIGLLTGYIMTHQEQVKKWAQALIDFKNQALAWFLEKWQEISDYFTNTLWPAIQLIWQVIAQTLGPSLERLWTTISTKLWPALQQLWQQVGPILTPALKIFAEIVGVVLLGAFLVITKAITETVNVLVQVLTWLIQIGTWISEQGMKLFTGIASAILSVVDAFKQLYEWAEKAWQKVQQFGGKVGGGVSGVTGKIGDFLGFDTGGVVPGPIGSPQLAVVHGGETILPTHKGGFALAGAAAGMGPTFNISISGNTLLDRDSARIIGEEFVRYLKDNARL